MNHIYIQTYVRCDNLNEIQELLLFLQKSFAQSLLFIAYRRYINSSSERHYQRLICNIRLATNCDVLVEILTFRQFIGNN